MSATSPLFTPSAVVRSHRIVTALLVVLLAVAAAIAVYLIVGDGVGAGAADTLAPGAGMFVEDCISMGTAGC
jgi:hypothetical protein